MFIRIRHLTVTLALLLLALAPAAYADLTFAVTSQTVPATWPYEQVIGVFKFTNTGKETVKITSLQSSCRCTTPKLDKAAYAPGESGELDAVFKVDYQRGPQSKTITLKTDLPTQPAIAVTFQTDIPDVLKFDRLLLHWNAGADPAPQTVDITLPSDVPLDNLTADAGTAPFTVTLKTLTPGTHYQVTVTPTPAAGKFQSVDIKVVLKLKDGTTKTRTFQAIIS